MKRWELLVNLFEACNCWKSLAQLHCQTFKAGLTHDSFFATKLNALYAKYASLEHARKVFDETPHRTVYLWNAALRGYCRDKQWEETLRLFCNMISNASTDDDKPDNFTVPIALRACAGLRALECGKAVHGLIQKHDKVGEDMYVGAALIEFYSKCGLMDDALQVFKEFSLPDVVLWTSMVTGYEQNGNPEEALRFFTQMVMEEGLVPDRVTLVSVVSACAQLSNFKLGSSVHCFVVRRGFNTDITLDNSLLNLYAKTGSIKSATCLFRRMLKQDVISWSSIIACHALNGAAVEALDLFNEMINGKVEPNSITVVNALQACSVVCNLEEGTKIHELAIWKGFELDVSVSTALIDMYMKCFTPDKAVDLFQRMPKKDVVSCAALLGGYAHNGMAHQSIGVFRNMLIGEIQPDAIAMVKVLAACAQLGILQQALCLHGYVKKRGFNNNIFVGASLIELYSKCGSLADAIQIFEGIVDKDVYVWSAMIAAYAIHGCGEEAINIFDQMVENSAVRPNNITFLSVLSACSHSGLVEKGLEIFNLMPHGYQLNPNSEHYGMVVDLLGRTGELEKAMEIINKMPFPAGPHIWGALLGACRIHHNVNLGEVAAKNLFNLDPNHSGYYILLSNIYAVDEKWESVAELRTLIKEKKMKKMFGQSVVDAGSEVYSFVAGDRFHPDSEQIYELLKKLEVKMREEAYSPDLEFLQHDGEFF
ncbi:DYW domain containing protein [Parasponia andersonii]|uniref:DYW domain containing protein n=1 Tax=Parasponia andersonii TaxID=3476 RepID=A0A2P5A3X3_PARAD|nr:DYW domain containing protein [Parasponia andersonii]